MRFSSVVRAEWESRTFVLQIEQNHVVGHSRLDAMLTRSRLPELAQCPPFRLVG